MYPVTNEWKAINNNPIRNPSYIKIVFGIQDPDAPFHSTATDNGHLDFSKVADIGTSVSPSVTYQTLERNRFVLDGKAPIPDEENMIYQAFAGWEISVEDRKWAVNPKVTISFSDYFQFPGLTFTFDTTNNEYPEKFQLIVKNDDAEVYNKILQPESAYFGLEEQIPIGNYMEIIFLESKTPHRRARLLSLVFGLVEQIETNEIVKCTCTKEVDLMSTKFPKQDFDFTIIDTEKRYDPENPKGVWEYLESRQPVSVLYGFELSEGNIEWIPLCTSYSSGDFEVNGQDVISEVTIKCVGLIEHLNQTYDEGVYSPEGKSLFDLAKDVAQFAGFDEAIDLDEELKNITTHNPLHNSAVNDCLQLIANAGRCIMNHTRGGYIEIKRENTNSVDFQMTMQKMLGNPTTSKIPPLRNLTTEYSLFTVEESVSKAIDAVQVDNANGEEYVFTHGAYTEHSIVVTGTLQVIGEAKFFAYKTIVNLTGSGTITINGKGLRENRMSHTESYGEVGEDLDSVRNALIDNKADAVAYNQWIAACTLRRITYKGDDRGYPELDVGDHIGMVSNFLNEVDMTLTEQKIEYDGGITGSFSGIIWNGSDDT